MSCTIDDWKAKASGAGDERVITVIGNGTCPESGYSLRLEPTNEGVIDDPKVAALRLIIEAPPAGADVVTPVHVETEIRGDPATNIRIDTPEGSQWAEVVEGG